MIGVHNQRTGDAAAQVSLGFASVPLSGWPGSTSALVDTEQRTGTERVASASPAVATKQDEQAALRHYAATLLTEASTEAAALTAPVAKPEQDERLSPFTMAAMLLLAGCIFLVVIPPVGVTFLLCAVLPLIWGAGTAALGSS
jgi:hypothetical protein